MKSCTRTEQPCSCSILNFSVTLQVFSSKGKPEMRQNSRRKRENRGRTMNYWEMFTTEKPKVSKKSLSLSPVFFMGHYITLKTSPYTKNFKTVHSEDSVGLMRNSQTLLMNCDVVPVKRAGSSVGKKLVCQMHLDWNRHFSTSGLLKTLVGGMKLKFFRKEKGQP